MDARHGHEHHAVLGRPDPELSDAERPEAGPVAILPEPQRLFADAVAAAGGQAEELSERTRGIVWLGGRPAAELARVLEEHPGVQWVQLPSAGVEAYADLLRSTGRRERMLWTSAKGAFSEPVAEHALALSLALLRHLPERARATAWDRTPLGTSLYGRRVVIVGAGGIARELVRLLQPFDVRITIVRRSEGEVEGVERTVTADHLREVLPGATLVVLAAALTPGSAHIVGARELAAMDRDARLVNIARGGLVDTDALVAALAAGEIAGAALDVTDPEPLPDGHPLWSEPHCLITPHNADTPEMTAPLLAERVRTNVAALLGRGRFVGIVDPAAGY